MTESVFESVKKSCQVLKLDFSSAELAIMAQEQELTPEQLQAVSMMMDHLRQKKVDTTIQTLLKMSRLPFHSFSIFIIAIITLSISATAYPAPDIPIDSFANRVVNPYLP